MGISCRKFLLDRNDQLFLLANTKFVRMLEEPARHRLPSFSGQRVRAAEAFVELLGREPIRVIRITFDILGFDDEGCFDPSRYCEQQRARAEVAIEPVISSPDRKAKVVPAAGKFIARGSQWIPTIELAQTIHEAALGRIKCPRA